MIVKTLLQNGLPFILDWWKKRKNKKEEETEKAKTPIELYKEYYEKNIQTLAKVKWEEIVVPPVGTISKTFSDEVLRKEHDDEKKTLMIVDDYKDVIHFFDRGFRKLREKDENKFVYETHNVYQVLGQKCSLSALKLINTKKVDIAILDLSLGDITKFTPEVKITLDGVDIAIELLKKSPDCKFVFATAHNFSGDEGSGNIRSKYTEKFKLLTNKDIKDYIVSKNDIEALYAKFEELIYGK